MSLFSKKPTNDTVAPLPDGPYQELKCMAAVSLDGQRHVPETTGAVRFYTNEMVIFAQGMGGLLKDALFKLPFAATKLKEQMRVAYPEIVRSYHLNKRTVQIVLQDGRYAYFIFGLETAKKEDFLAQLAAHGVGTEPFAGK